MMPPVRDDQDSSMDSRSSFMMAGKSSMDLSNLHQQSQSQDQLHQLHQASGSPSAMPNHIGLSKAELRKSNKPIMEKKRRARINHCLNELKTLILEAMKKDPARHTKLEKADILEMTVKYLQTMQRSQLNMAVQADPNVLHKFKAGFSDCTDEVNRYISQMDGVDSGVKQRLIGHLNSCVTGIQQVAAPYNAFNGSSNNNFRSSSSGNSMPFSSSMQAHQSGLLPLAQDVNNNGGRIQMGGVQLIPSRLPTGELALVMPNSSNLPYFPASAFPLNGNGSARNSLDLSTCTSLPRASAFNSVCKTNGKHLSTDTSPPLSPASSMSSGDDSLTNADYQPLTTTPPLQSQANFLNAFPTPPSGGSISMIPSISISRVSSTVSSVTLQQQQVTSTTEPPAPAPSQQPPTSNNISIKIKPLSVITNTAGNTQLNARPDVQYVNKKRPYPVELSDDDNKSVKSEPIDKVFKSEEPAQNQNDGDSNADMWRPW